MSNRWQNYAVYFMSRLSTHKYMMSYIHSGGLWDKYLCKRKGFSDFEVLKMDIMHFNSDRRGFTEYG